MKNKTKRNKKYKPRPVQADSYQWALVAKAKLSEQSKLEFLQPLEDAFNQAVEGKITRTDWNCLANGLNIAEGLANLGICSNLKDDIMRGQKVLADMAHRMKATGDHTTFMWGLEMGVLKSALEVFEIQTRFCSNREMSEAVHAANNPKNYPNCIVINEA